MKIKKMISVSVLSLGVLAVTFAASASTALAVTGLYGHHNPQMIVDISANAAISANEAKVLGAQYIADIFGEQINTVAIITNFCSMSNQWVGTVTEAQVGTPHSLPLFQFTIDANTGQRIGIQDFRRLYVNLPERTLTLEEISNFSAVTPANVAEYEQLVKEFAQLHFNNSLAVDVVYENRMARSRRTSTDHSTFAYNETLMSFSATDSAGNSVRISIGQELGRLISITPNRNFILRDPNPANMTAQPDGRSLGGVWIPDGDTWAWIPGEGDYTRVWTPGSDTPAPSPAGFCPYCAGEEGALLTNCRAFRQTPEGRAFIENMRLQAEMNRPSVQQLTEMRRQEAAQMGIHIDPIIYFYCTFTNTMNVYRNGVRMTPEERAAYEATRGLHRHPRH